LDQIHAQAECSHHQQAQEDPFILTKSKMATAAILRSPS